MGKPSSVYPFVPYHDENCLSIQLSHNASSHPPTPELPSRLVMIGCGVSILLLVLCARAVGRVMLASVFSILTSRFEVWGGEPTHVNE